MNRPILSLLACTAALVPLATLASSHREAPFIAGQPRVDGTDFYMFRSYEPGREQFVTFIANYNPLQDAYGGPNYFTLDPKALYEIRIDNDGDARPDLTFQFRFTNTLKGLTVDAGGKNVAVPLTNIGPVNPAGANLNVIQSYTIELVRGDPREGERQAVTNATLGGHTFFKPVDNIGNKSIDNYPAYAANFIYNVAIPGCATHGRVFVGQRKDGFVVNLGEIFDLVNLNPVGARNAAPNTIADKNVTSIALEVPISCLVHKDPVIGAWTTASVPAEAAAQSESAGAEAADGWGGREVRRRCRNRRPQRCEALEFRAGGHALEDGVVICGKVWGGNRTRRAHGEYHGGGRAQDPCARPPRFELQAWTHGSSAAPLGEPGNGSSRYGNPSR